MASTSELAKFPKVCQNEGMTQTTSQLPGVLDGDLIEFFRPFASVRTGIVENLPSVRHVARVVFEKADGTLVCSGEHGETVRVRRSEVTADLGPAFAGWAVQS